MIAYTIGVSKAGATRSDSVPARLPEVISVISMPLTKTGRSALVCYSRPFGSIYRIRPPDEQSRCSRAHINALFTVHLLIILGNSALAFAHLPIQLTRGCDRYYNKDTVAES